MACLAATLTNTSISHTHSYTQKLTLTHTHRVPRQPVCNRTLERLSGNHIYSAPWREMLGE